MSSYKELVFFSSIFFFIARRNLLCISLKKEWKQFWRTWKLSFASIAKNTATVDAAIYFAAAATQILFDVLIHWPQSVVVSQHAAVERRWANAQITGMLFIQPVLLHWKKKYTSQSLKSIDASWLCRASFFRGRGASNYWRYSFIFERDETRCNNFSSFQASCFPRGLCRGQGRAASSTANDWISHEKSLAGRPIKVPPSEADVVIIG